MMRSQLSPELPGQPRMALRSGSQFGSSKAAAAKPNSRALGIEAARRGLKHESNASLQLTRRFEEALILALASRNGQLRKGTQIAHVPHLQAAASIVIDIGWLFAIIL